MIKDDPSAAAPGGASLGITQTRGQTPRIGVCSRRLLLPARFGPSTTRRSTAESAFSAAAAKSSAAGALRLWPGFTDVEATPPELMRVQFGNGSLRLFV